MHLIFKGIMGIISGGIVFTNGIHKFVLS